MGLKLKSGTITTIRKDNDLYVKVANALGVGIASLNVILSRNTKRLTEYHVLSIISEHTGTEIDNLIEENAEVKAA